jgi:pimeloyl-ACP methyl ester carboxylesterase
MQRRIALSLALTLGTLAAPVMAQEKREPATAKRTYVRLANNANAVLVEPIAPSPNEHVVAINVHPDNLNTFEYFVGRELAKHGYRTIEINYYGQEKVFEEFLSPIAKAIRYARSLPGVDTVILVGHSGGGPELTYYQQIAENGPAACQKPNRIYKCSGDGLADLPKADAMLVLEANIGAPHRVMGLDPSITGEGPGPRDPALDLYAAANGFDEAKGIANYSAAFARRYSAALHGRSAKIIADAEARLDTIEAGNGLFRDDEPFVVTGTATSSLGPRLNLQDGSILSETHGAHIDLMADGSRPVGVVHSVRVPAAPRPAQRNSYGDLVMSATVRHYLSFSAITTTPDFALTRNDIKGVDWSSSANSAAGSVEGITVPTLVMAGSCTIHMVPLEIVFDHAAAKDKEFVVVDGGNHEFEPCRPEFGDSQKRAFDYVQGWLEKRFPAKP